MILQEAVLGGSYEFTGSYVLSKAMFQEKDIFLEEAMSWRKLCFRESHVSQTS